MAPEKDILLGIDFGTGGCKVTAIDFSGVVAGEASVEYPTHFPRPGWAEQTPGDWYASLCGALRKIEERGVTLRRVFALSLDGSTHNAVLLDDRMTPLRDTIMWTDQRSTEECAFLKENYGELIFFTAYQNPARSEERRGG